jgi:hypothetical protein
VGTPCPRLTRGGISALDEDVKKAILTKGISVLLVRGTT